MTHLPALYSVARAAAVLKLSPRRVQALIQQQRLPARKVGRAYVIDHDDLYEFARLERPTGRPKRILAAAARAAAALVQVPDGELEKGKE